MPTWAFAAGDPFVVFRALLAFVLGGIGGFTAAVAALAVVVLAARTSLSSAVRTSLSVVSGAAVTGASVSNGQGLIDSPLVAAACAVGAIVAGVIARTPPGPRQDALDG